jgi:ketol-acid reductoisomerase
MTEYQRKKRIKELLQAINSGMFSEEQTEKMRKEVDDLRLR